MFMDLAQSTLNRFQEGAKGDLEKRQTAITEMVKPVRESLDKFESKIQEIEKARVGAYEGLHAQVRSLVETQTALKTETVNLVKALGTPRVRGRWGEIQLRRVVEIAGMLDHCDFSEQQTAATEDGWQRPDLVVHLAGGKSLIVDAKVPLAGYLEAIEAPDESTRRLKLQDHARHLRDHAMALGKKSYWEQFNPAPEFVVLFVPGESFFAAALEHSPDLIEQAVAERVLIATPITLIALLKAAAYGWRQERIAQNAADISALGKELYKRISDVASNFSSLGSALSKAVDTYNRAVYNLESRVLSSARKFHELDSTGVEGRIEPPEPIESSVRTLQAQEILGGQGLLEQEKPHTGIES
ncbi:MAG: DNA recombination protein RmuC [Proteobacteria bacterium]|nr:DNA recombination protein RmuC [Pseudomonadota bacterium]